jgi:archaellum component FlaC
VQTLADVSQDLINELLRRLHHRADKSDVTARELRNELNSMRLVLHAHQNDINNLYGALHQLDARMERIENRLERRELAEAQARFEPHP